MNHFPNEWKRVFKYLFMDYICISCDTISGPKDHIEKLSVGEVLNQSRVYLPEILIG